MTLLKDMKFIKSSVGNYIKRLAIEDFSSACFELSCYVDGLCKDGEISEKTYMNLYLHKNKKKQIILVCNSYRIKL